MALVLNQSASLTANNTGIGPLVVNDAKLYSISLSGTFTATISLQRTFDNGATWVTIKTYTAAAEETGQVAEACQVRLQCTAYTSGTAVCRLGTY